MAYSDFGALFFRIHNSKFRIVLHKSQFQFSLLAHHVLVPLGLEH